MLAQLFDPANFTFSPYSIPTMITALAALLVGMLVLVRERISLISVSFFLLTLIVAWWLFASSWVYAAINDQAALMWVKVEYVGAPFIGACTYQFTIAVLRIYDRYKKIAWFGWAVSALFSVAALFSNALIGGVYHYWWGYYARYNWLGALFLIFFIGLLIASMAHYWTEYRAALPGIHKRRVQSLIIACAIAYIAAVDLVPKYGIPIYPFGYLPIFIFIAMAARAIWTYHLVDITPAFAAIEIMDTMSDALIVLDPGAVARVVNPAACQLLGYRADELVGKPLSAMTTGSLLTGPLGALAQKRAIQNYETVYYPKTGGMRVLSISASAMKSERGDSVATVLIARDVTERKRTEGAVRESVERYRAVVEQASEGIFLFNPHSKRFLEANAAFVIMLGYTIGELLELTLYDVVAHDRESIDRNVARILKEGRYSVGERQYRCKDGSLVDVEVSINSISHGGREVLCAVVHDITERKRAEERVKRQVDRLGALRQIDMAITASLDLRVTLNVILDQVTAQLRTDAAAVLLFNARTQTLEHGAGRGLRSDKPVQSRIRLGEGHAGRAVLERRSIYLYDLREVADGTDGMDTHLRVREGFAAYFVVPLLAKGQVKGALEVYHRSALDPDQEWLGFLEALAGQAAIAIDNATMFDDLQLSNLELALAYDTTLEGWSRALDLRDEETEGHTRRVTELTMHLALSLGINEADVVHMRRGALLHDIGKWLSPTQSCSNPDRSPIKSGRSCGAIQSMRLRCCRP